MVMVESKSNTKLWGLGLVLFCFWLGFSLQGLVSAVKIWYISEIFNHCFFVIPVSIYLIWEKRNEVDWLNRSLSFYALPLIVLQVLLYLVGIAGDIQLFQHAALFALLPTLIWFYLGNKITYQLIFPLYFMLFAIPFGEEFIPFLQEITADLSVIMVSWTGIPLYRSGLFLEIPQGRFLVAEACSGVSFLIASVVLGNLYSYMNLKLKRTRIFFVLLSILFPIIANAIRVFGIIVIGYASDMEHAVGADHLIYGWFFFAFVIVCLLGIGELVRRFEAKRLPSSATAQIPATGNIDNNSHGEKSTLTIAKMSIVLLILVLGIVKTQALNSASQNTPPYPIFDLPISSVSEGNRLGTWQPEFQKASYTEFNTGLMKGIAEEQQIVYFLAYYDGSDGELISAQNKIFGEKRWSLAGRQKVGLDSGNSANQITLRSGNGSRIKVNYFYVIDGLLFTDNKKAKLYQVWLKLQGKPYDGVFFAMSGDSSDEKSTLKELDMAATALVSAFNQRK
ncbi:exosortase A [Glaciecola sp. MH2013]|uniref:exosortase A n=1 Tax=Glaciecola sp. MH2013 TaxID=2785524 RepID=UPI00189C9D6A|nr:exosortase A [Glaciecola sp. MH2013]MBF7072152.1 exosortase A [Glaciecola sp. MH2013]